MLMPTDACRRPFLLVAAVAATTTPLFAQAPPRELGAPLRQSSATRAPNGSDVAESVVFDAGLGAALLRVPAEASARIESWPIAPAARATVLVTRHDVYAPGMRILKTGGGQEIEVPRSRLVFLWGHSEDDLEARVLMWVDPDTGNVEGWSTSALGSYNLTPPQGAGRAQMVVSQDAMSGGQGAPGPSWSCGGHEGVRSMQSPHSGDAQLAASVTAPAITSLHTVTLAIDTDNELMAQKFKESTTAATNYLAQLFAALNVIHERDLLIRLLQGQTFLRTATLGPDPWSVDSNGDASPDELYQFAAYWNAVNGGVKRGLAALLSGKSTSANASSGRAFIGQLCVKPTGGNSGGYSFTKVYKFTGSTGASDALLVGHELGHNLGSPHTHCIPPGQSSVIDTCYTGELSNTGFSCWAGPTSCPAAATYQGVRNVTGTLMSSCHLGGSNGVAGCTSSQVYHPRTIQLLQPEIQANVNNCVIPLVAPLPTLSIGDASVTEGDSGTSNASFTVTMSSASSSAVTVAYATSAGTAAAGSDYTTTSGTLTIDAGATTGTVGIPVLGDTLDEANETFTLTLGSPNGATLEDATATGTINDNDPAPTVSINSATLAEADTGAGGASFTATLSAVSGQTVTVNYGTADGTATAGVDYSAQSGILTFAPGITSQPITISVLGDRIFEANETFSVTLSSPGNATLGTATGTGTIDNDDAQGFSANDATGLEGLRNVVFTVTLAPPVAAQTKVAYSTANGTATAGSDYTAASGTLTFAAHETSKTIAVTVGARDLAFEAPETLTLNLSGAVGAAIGSPRGTGTIMDTPRAPGDLGGDYKSDVVWRKVAAGVDKGALFLWTMNGAGLTGARYLDPISEDWQVQFTGDFNGDGKTDVLWRNLNSSTADAGDLFIWMMDGPNLIGGTGYTAAQADLSWRVDGVGDLNGDGKSDILWRKTGAGVDKGAVFLWALNGTSLAGARYLDPISEDWQVVDLGDFNGDGKSDVLWRNMNATSPDAGKLYIWMMDGPNVIGGTGYTASQADLGWRIDGVGDLNGDGNHDIVWRKTGAGVDKGAVFLWTMNRTGLAGARYLDPIGEDWQVQGLGDFNGDGKTDVLWRNQGPGVDVGKLYVWLMDGANVIGGTGYTTAQADLGWRVESPRK